MPDERFPEWGLSKDEELYSLYKSNIFEPGWAGELSESQTDYIQGVLTGRYRWMKGRSLKRLRETWGMRPWQEFISVQAVRDVAMFGEPEEPDHNTRLIEKSILRELFFLTA